MRYRVGSIIALVLLLQITLVPSLQAADSSQADQFTSVEIKAANDHDEAMIRCYAYFLAWKQCAERDRDTQLSERLDVRTDDLFPQILTFSTKLHRSTKDVSLEIDELTSEMMTDMKNSCGNFNQQLYIPMNEQCEEFAKKPRYDLSKSPDAAASPCDSFKAMGMNVPCAPGN